jgi:hypothetical protein
MGSNSYTKVNNRPIFVFYRPDIFRDPANTINNYRDEFDRVGINPLFGYFLKNAYDIDFSSIFDFCYLFEPRLFFNNRGFRKSKIIHSIFRRIIHLIDYTKAEYMSEHIGKILNIGVKSYRFSTFIKYFKSIERVKLIDAIQCPVQNILTCGWNNAPRYRDRFKEVQVPSPEQFSIILNSALDNSKYSEDLPLLCNAWNEWSEGAAIEPCYYLGDYLLKTYVDKHE